MNNLGVKIYEPHNWFFDWKLNTNEGKILQQLKSNGGISTIPLSSKRIPKRNVSSCIDELVRRGCIVRILSSDFFEQHLDILFRKHLKKTLPHLKLWNKYRIYFIIDLDLLRSKFLTKEANEKQVINFINNLNEQTHEENLFN